MKQTGLCIVSLLGGALLGAAAAMLLTPKTGCQMRDSLRDFIADHMEGLRCKCHAAGCKTEAVKPQQM
jgi:gas vesicle protein